MPWSDKPVTPKYLEEYEYQQALVNEFYEYQGVYDGLPSDHKYNGNKGKYWEIYRAECDKVIAVQREESARYLAEIRGSRVTTGHKDKPYKPKRNSNPNPLKGLNIVTDLVPNSKIGVSLSFLNDFPSGLLGNSHQRIESGILTMKLIEHYGSKL